MLNTRAPRPQFRHLAGLLLLPLMLLAACTSSPLGADVQQGQAAYTTMNSMAQGRDQTYRIGPLDTIDVTVFQEPELSAKELEVDASGNISIPLVGSITATGKTAPQLSQDIAMKLGERYLKNPQVSVTVASSASQRVTVQGQVTQPGIYDIKGPTTLLQTLSLAKGETQSAALNQVVVFRTMNGQRMGAVFDVDAIRKGRAADPQILGNDIVVVGFSQARSLWRDILSTTPLLNIFRPIIMP